MNKPVTIYSIFLFFYSGKIEFSVNKWAGKDTGENYKVYHVPDREVDQLRDGSFKLVNKDKLDKIAIGGDCAHVNTLNEEAIEDWKGELINKYMEHLEAKKEEAIQNYDNAQTAVENYRKGLNK
jgi:hypothetical protein